MTTAVSTAPVAPADLSGRALRRPRLVPVPDSEPPYDDELTATNRLRTMMSRHTAGPLTVRRPVTPAHPTTVRDGRVPEWSTEADIGVRSTASKALRPVEQAARVLARALVEVLSGSRPVAQLRIHCAPQVFAGLERRPTQRSATTLTSVRVCEPADGVAEVSVVLRTSGRSRALAFRLEGLDGRWRITELQTG